ncbi:MAG TPA: helix-turn-helix domain-containing protein [Steroidobacteraceae bacterium]|nr:helix-turn-helix domain-containing protein [Steroidobacteraceae bacterium]
MFLSVACIHWELVITRLQGRSIVTLRGPETRPSEWLCPADGEWLGIRFKAGTFMPQLPVHGLMDNPGVNLPQLSKRTFLLDGKQWEFPTVENAETFVSRLVSKGLVARDPEVTAALRGEPTAVSTRSAQRRFRQVTGMTFTQLRQIERARHAVGLLKEGVPIADVVWRCGFYDHAHLTRSLQRWIGLAPTDVVRGDTQLSFLYKTEGFPLG